MSRLEQLLLHNGTALLKEIANLDSTSEELDTVVNILSSYRDKLTKNEDTSGINNAGTIQYKITTFVKGV